MMMGIDLRFICTRGSFVLRGTYSQYDEDTGMSADRNLPIQKARLVTYGSTRSGEKKKKKIMERDEYQK
jgi:hypothetical protein